jgi:hypothetical protein
MRYDKRSCYVSHTYPHSPFIGCRRLTHHCSPTSIAEHKIIISLFVNLVSYDLGNNVSNISELPNASTHLDKILSILLSK